MVTNTNSHVRVCLTIVVTVLTLLSVVNTKDSVTEEMED